MHHHIEPVDGTELFARICCIGRIIFSQFPSRSESAVADKCFISKDKILAVDALGAVVHNKSRHRHWEHRDIFFHRVAAPVVTQCDQAHLIGAKGVVGMGGV